MNYRICSQCGRPYSEHSTEYVTDAPIPIFGVSRYLVNERCNLKLKETKERLEAVEVRMKAMKLKVGDKYNGHQMSPLTLSVKEIVDEYKGAIQKFPPFNSAHEGLAVIEEEFLELQDEVFKQHHARTKERMRAEAKQVAAMALRFMIDVTS